MREPAQSVSDRTLTSQQRRELLHRVQQSPVFSRSPALRSFLEYIVENSIRGNLEQIKEQSIGATALGRGPNYDPTTDNIVRVRAHELRHKLEKYFETVGLQEPVVISIPRGTYIPEFRSRAVDPPPGEAGEAAAVKPEAPATVPPLRMGRAWRRLPWLLSALLAVALLVSLFRSSPRAARATGLPDGVRDFWGPVFSDPARPVVAVSADSGFALWQNLNNQDLNLGDYLARKYLQLGPSDPRMRELAARRLTSPADVAVNVRLAELSRLLGGRFIPEYARNVQVQQLRESNAVLIGSRRSNPWVELFESRLNFVLVRDDKTGASFFRNRSPRPGESPVYTVSEVFASFGTEEHEVESYALLAVVPGLDGQGRVVLIEGLNMEGTQAAGEMVTDPIPLSGLLAGMGHAAGTPVPPFEALLKVSSVPGGYANCKAIAFRYLVK